MKKMLMTVAAVALSADCILARLPRPFGIHAKNLSF
jgi:hypothetical protein